MRIPIRCRTNLDEFRNERWPREVLVRPMVGDRIRSESGKELVIYSITHCIYKSYMISAVDYEMEPILELYLHKPKVL